MTGAGATYACAVCGSPLEADAPGRKENSLVLRLEGGLTTTIMLCTKTCRDMLWRAIKDPDAMSVVDVWRVYLRPKIDSGVVSVDQHGETMTFFKGSAASLIGHTKDAERIMKLWVRQLERDYGFSEQKQSDDDGDDDDAAAPAADD